MTLIGEIKEIRYTDERWSAVKVSYVNTNGKTVLASVSGAIPTPIIGVTMEFYGDWEQSQYGPQFKVTGCKMIMNRGIVNFLSSGYIKGVGPKIAELIYDNFGEKSIDIIKSDWQKLANIKGISLDKAEKIHNNVEGSFLELNIMQALNYEITKNKIDKIIAAYGRNSVKVINKNPYQLIYDIRGFGFSTVDRLAKASGIAASDPRRVKAAIMFTIESVADAKGDLYMDIDSIYDNTLSIVKDIKVKEEVFVEQVAELINDNYLYADGNDIYIKEYYRAEKMLAEMITDKLKEQKSTKYQAKVNRLYSNINDKIDNCEFRYNVQFDGTQKFAIENALKNCFSIITGGPGTGKTTIIKAITDCYCGYREDIVLLAPTGRAARRMSEVVKLPAYTLCRFLHRQREIGEKLENKLIIVDEMSMVDLLTTKELLWYTDSTCTVIFVGDIDQLPPIGSGNVFRDLVELSVVPKVKLQLSHRFSGILSDNAARINRGQFMLDVSDNFKIVKEGDAELREKIMIEEYMSALEKANNDYTKVQIILPRKKNLSTACENINNKLREICNPVRKTNVLSLGRNKFRAGDRIMNTQNNYTHEISNGDCGIITDVISRNECMIKMDSGRIITLNAAELDSFVLAYAITVHKSQGSEYETVIFSCGTCDFIMLQRNLLYTAVTRAKSNIVMICETKALAMAVNNIKPIIRNTKLKDRILALM